MANRLSTFSNGSSALNRPSPRPTSQVSTQTLLTALHTSYSTGKPFSLESSTSLVVNTWASAASGSAKGKLGGNVDVDIAIKAWEHARRRAEDGCIILGYLHESCPSLLEPFVSALPFSVPSTLFSALTAIQPFVTSVSPQNPSASRYSALAVTFTLSLSDRVSGASLKLGSSGLDTANGLTSLPSKRGWRAFDVFYYLLSTASSPAEREALGLRAPFNYSLLKKSETYDPPSYIPTADDAAAAEEWRAALKAIGITGTARRDLLALLAALLKIGDTLGFLLDEEELDRACEDAAGLLGIEPDVLVRKCSTNERESLLAALYEAVVDWVIFKANAAIHAELNRSRNFESASDDGYSGVMTPNTDEDTVNITILDIPGQALGKAASMRTVFDDSEGINAEMKQDGVTFAPAGHSVVTEMQAAVAECEPELGIMTGKLGREKELQDDKKEAILEKISHSSEEDGFIEKVISLDGSNTARRDATRFDLSTLISSSRVWFHLSLHPTDELPETISPNFPAWSAGSPSRQIRAWRLPEWANRRNKQLDFTADFDLEEFCTRYARLGCNEGRDGIESFIAERGWSNGEVFIGTERVWIRETAWREAENLLEMLPQDGVPPSPQGAGMFGSPFGDNGSMVGESRDNLLNRNQSSATLGNRSAYGAKSVALTAAPTFRSASAGDYGLGFKGDDTKGANAYTSELDPELANAKKIEEQKMTMGRRLWVIFVWCLTWIIPSPLLRYVGGMKRPDVRMAWREKLVLCALILLLNGAVVFYIIEFGRLLCPNFDRAWNSQQVGFHQGDNDMYISVRGSVYDISKFWRLDHSSIVSEPVQSTTMQTFAGKNVDFMFPIPLQVGCPKLVKSSSVLLLWNATNEDPAVVNQFQHTSGSTSTLLGSTLRNEPNWFNVTFLPYMKQYYKGELVWSPSTVASVGQDQQYQWFILNGNVYDLSNYFYTKSTPSGAALYSYLDSNLENMVTENPGQDITALWNKWAKGNATAAAANLQCIQNVFYIGKTDFREGARCQVNNYILLGFTIILCAVILVKFLAALQLGSKRRPTQQDKFVICQIPAYTEGEDHLRKSLDSITALQYDNKRKLICVICDGVIVGGGNDRPTPKIVLDILGVDPKIDPPALPFKSVGSGSEQLNYGKVYSGLYEFEGNVVPYIVVVKVGKESEQSKAKPGNRGKRDSQILLMSFLNRVHHRSPMSPLELEMFHQINNIIGVDPELYEYLFMVDADTAVKEDALNRLVASCANDGKIAGICGETSLQNEERSWWTMIQVYEYYISHHLAKAFESLFGSVTCLPGCFCMYRLRTIDKGKPLIISDKVINEYSDCNVDTLHKKNLLSLGEDRYLTTLMTKHFPNMSYKFIPDAYAQTAAPETWSILLSQRRRWINSTIHNLVELMFLKDLCGFCCFSMRFVVFIDLFGTIILPATCAYLAYLIYRVATHSGQFPLISIVMLSAVYGLQAIIFIIKRQWQHVGWMIIYILAYPVYSLLLPIYAFWKQDDFSWGQTRIVIGEKGNKQVIATTEDEGFDPRSIPLQRWDDYALANNLPGRRGNAATGGSEKGDGGYDEGYEMDDIRSNYSSVKPASTIMTGFKSYGGGMYAQPQTPGPYMGRPDMIQRQSNYSNFSAYQDPNGRVMSMMNPSEAGYPMRSPPAFAQSQEFLLQSQSPPLNRAGTRSPGFQSRPTSTLPLPDFTASPDGQKQPNDGMIVEAVQACLGVVDLDTVSKKTLKALVEQRLQCQLNAERKAFLDQQIDFQLANM